MSWKAHSFIYQILEIRVYTKYMSTQKVNKAQKSVC